MLMFGLLGYFMYECVGQAEDSGCDDVMIKGNGRQSEKEDLGQAVFSTNQLYRSVEQRMSADHFHESEMKLGERR